VTRRELMAFSKIASVATYHKCIRELDAFGYIRYYPSYHPKLGSQVYWPCRMGGSRVKSKRIAVYQNSFVYTQLYKQLHNCIVRPLSVLPRKRGEQAEVGRTRLFRLLCGAKQICVYRRYTFPPLNAARKEKSIPGGIRGRRIYR
jgi:hypothetical protein